MADLFDESAADSGIATPVDADVEMGGAGAGAGEVVIDLASVAVPGNGEIAVEEAPEEVPARETYVDYLRSPVVELLVGQGEEQAVLSAHQALLVKSPWFAEECAKAGSEPRKIDLVDEDLDAVGCFLEFLYTGEYFPKRIVGSRDLEQDPSVSEVDETGDQLLKHARVYTLGEMLKLPALKTLASSKIHCVNSTAKGELAYARYVYANTQKDDTSIRAPVANFWATRSHTLRSEAEEEFRSMCLEFPQFGYDVLTRVLDEKLKREKNDRMHPSSSAGGGSGRKRPRQSTN